jgi:RPA family protein
MSGEDGGGAGRREVAYRVLAAEFDDADFSYSESDEERAPNYVVTPTGARINRLFVVGVLTEVEQAGEDILRARVVDPTGAFVVYAGQYQPDAQAFFERADPPAFVAVTGKARTFQPDDADVVYTSVRPENVNEVTAETRDRWNVQAARQTLDRVATMADALAREQRGDDLRRVLESEGVDAGLASGVPLAVDHYGTTAAYLDAVRDLAVGVAEVVAGERDEVDPLRVDPDDPGDVEAASLAGLDVPASVGGTDGSLPDGEETGATAAQAESTGATESGAATTDAVQGPGDSGGSETTTAAENGTDAATTTQTETDTGTGSEGETASGTETDTSTAESTDATGGETGPTSAADASADAADSTAEESPVEEPATTGDAGPATDPTSESGADEEIGEFEPGEFDIDDEEREQIESEYGTDFKSGTEVDDPGEADIDTPDPETTPDAEDPGETGTATETGSDTSAAGTESATPSGEEGVETADASEPAADDDVDIDTAVIEAMENQDEGDGAPESAIVAEVTDRLGVDEAAVTDALQDALMGGQCYEPDDGVYKPI